MKNNSIRRNENNRLDSSILSGLKSNDFNITVNPIK
jgi:hypothetical protein